MQWRCFVLAVGLFVGGCATTRDAAADCDAFVSDELAQVFRKVERYRDHGFEEHLIGDARSALEHARQALYGEPMLRPAAVCPRQHQRQASWKDLLEDVHAAEVQVREIEEARGVRFVDFSEGVPHWVDATTGKPIPPDFADSI